ncbi:MAG: extracellular solute-binding protein [Defluviitaleaceae bacterium]|nr:extracellular solute-binding protein [Defluviitaleaceae bacterium]
MSKYLFRLCLLASLVFALFILSGCNRGNNVANSGLNAEEWVGQWDLPDEERWFGPFDETVTVRLAFPVNAAHEWEDGDSVTDNLWTRSFREHLNIEIDIMWEALHAGGDYETRLNLAIASGDVPDLIRFETATQFANMQTANQLMNMTTMFDRFAYPLVQELLRADGVAMTWGTVGEGLYGIPTQGIEIGSPRMLYMRRDWFEATGLPMPTTIEEFFHAAEVMARENNAFALGQAEGLIHTGGMADILGPANAFGIQPMAWVDDGEGGLVYGSLDHRLMEVLEIYARFHAEGLIDPGWTSLTGGELGEQLTTARIAAISSMVWLNGWPLGMGWDTDYWTDWIILPILPSETLAGPVEPQALIRPAQRLVSIREGFEYPEAFFKMWNYATAMLEDQVRGQQEIYHPRFMDNPFTYFPNPMQNPTTHRNLTAFATAYPDGNGEPDRFFTQQHDWQIFPNFQLFLQDEGTDRREHWANWSTWYGPNSTWGVLTGYMDSGLLYSCRAMGTITYSMVLNWPDLVDLEQTFFIEVVTGQRPVSDFVDHFIPTWMAMGGERITEEMNEWWATVN